MAGLGPGSSGEGPALHHIRVEHYRQPEVEEGNVPEVIVLVIPEVPNQLAYYFLVEGVELLELLESCIDEICSIGTARSLFSKLARL